MSLQRQVRMAGYDTFLRVDNKTELLVVAVRRNKCGAFGHVIPADDGGDMLIVPSDVVN